MVEQFLSERNVLVRGLAHPVTFGLANSLSGGDAGDTRAGASTSSSSMPFSLPFGGQQSQGRRSGDRGGAAFSGFLSTYGAVPVNGKNMYALLQNGEAVLLYPGGAREVGTTAACVGGLLAPQQLVAGHEGSPSALVLRCTAAQPPRSCLCHTPHASLQCARETAARRTGAACMLRGTHFVI